MSIFIYLAGVIVGAIIACMFGNIRKASGTLRIDHSNPKKDVYRIEIDDLDSLSDKKKIVLKVDNYADLSRK